jgi:hypothetical protein
MDLHAVRAAELPPQFVGRANMGKTIAQTSTSAEAQRIQNAIGVVRLLISSNAERSRTGPSTPDWNRETLPALADAID